MALEPIYKRWQDNDKLHIPKTPLGLSGILLELLKDYFRYNCTHFKYSEDPIESRILIDLHQQWNPANCENYPGVYIKRQAWQPKVPAKVLGDYKNFFMEKDGLSYEFWISVFASYGIMCVGKQYGELESLLNEIGMFFLSFGEPIRNCLNFAEFTVNEIGAVSLMQEEKEFRVGNINLNILFDFCWTLTLESPIIEKTKPVVSV